MNIFILFYIGEKIGQKIDSKLGYQNSNLGKPTLGIWIAILVISSPYIVLGLILSALHISQGMKLLILSLLTLVLIGSCIFELMRVIKRTKLEKQHDYDVIHQQYLQLHSQDSMQGENSDTIIAR